MLGATSFGMIMELLKRDSKSSVSGVSEEPLIDKPPDDGNLKQEDKTIKED